MKVNVTVGIPDGLFCAPNGGNVICKFYDYSDGAIGEECVLFSESVVSGSYDENGNLLHPYERDKYNYKKCKSCLEL